MLYFVGFSGLRATEDEARTEAFGAARAEIGAFLLTEVGRVTTIEDGDVRVKLENTVRVDVREARRVEECVERFCGDDARRAGAPAGADTWFRGGALVGIPLAQIKSMQALQQQEEARLAGHMQALKTADLLVSLGKRPEAIRVLEDACLASQGIAGGVVAALERLARCWGEGNTRGELQHALDCWRALIARPDLGALGRRKARVAEQAIMGRILDGVLRTQWGGEIAEPQLAILAGHLRNGQLTYARRYAEQLYRSQSTPSPLHLWLWYSLAELEAMQADASADSRFNAAQAEKLALRQWLAGDAVQTRQAALRALLVCRLLGVPDGHVQTMLSLIKAQRPQDKWLAGLVLDALLEESTLLAAP
jgi:hypothetical protein